MTEQTVHTHPPARDVGERRAPGRMQGVRQSCPQRGRSESEQAIGVGDDTQVGLGRSAVGDAHFAASHPNGDSHACVGHHQHDHRWLQVGGPARLPGEVLLEQAGEHLREPARRPPLDLDPSARHGSINTFVASRRSNRS